MKVFRKVLLLGMVAVLVSGCSIWPYKKDFDCPVKEGLKCKSLYEISEMADKGMFGPNAKQNKFKDCECNDQKTRKSRVRKIQKNRCYSAS